MKKFTLFLLAALMMTAVSMAQKPVGHELSKSRVAALVPGQKADAKQMPSKASLQKQVDLKRLQSARALMAAKKSEAKKSEKAEKATGMARAPKKVITGDESYITDQPEGRKQYYSRSGSAYYAYIFYVMNTSYSGAASTVVFGENNEVYIKNIISQYATNSWLKGTINGSKITIDFPQKAMEQSGSEYYVELLSYDANEGWFAPAEKQTLTLNYNATNGTISCPVGSAISTGDEIIGLVDATEGWTGYGDFAFSMTEMNDEPVTAPEGLETSDFAVVADGFQGTIAQVGFDGNDVWVQGLYPSMPNAWVKGTIDGNKATFKSGQFMGADDNAGYFQYFVSATAEEAWDDNYQEYYTLYSLSDADVVFDYDAATRTFSNSSCFLVNAGTSKVFYAAAYDKAKIYPFTEVATTPANPVWNTVYEGGYSYYNSGSGWGYLDFNLPTVDVNGDFILSDKMSYRIYTKVNGEEKLLTFSPDYYMYLDEEMEEVPYGFSEGWDFYSLGSGQNVYYYVIGPEAFGVQSVYRGAGEERCSEIAWYNISGLGSEVQPDAATPDYPDVDPSDVGSNIGYGFYTGKEDLNGFGEANEDSYDVAIQVKNEAVVGSYIESITFPLMATEGISNIKVWLSSQLRIEDGKNIPDLVSVDVTDAEAGFVTVKLDKPYIIPEEGVYVGYSLTIDDASKEVNKNPIAVFMQPNAGGFYLHTGREFLKWLNLSELMGMSSAIQVTLGGSKIADNAAAPQENETSYVMVNAPIEQQVTVVNHGAEGIKSLDIDYVLGGGLTGSQHIDLDEPVDGFFGQSTTVPVLLPSIPTRGTYGLEVTVSKVNGEENADLAPTAQSTVVVLNSVPKKRTVMEEYTGTWCGWCPRGFVALEKLAELSDGEYVLLSYHNSDPMEITQYFPNDVPGFPDAWLDRAEEVDPYYGTGGDDFFVAKDMARRNKSFGVASVEFQADMSDDGQAVNVSTEVCFPFDSEEADYALEYILVADGLTGEAGTDWDQSNYYSGKDDAPADLADFVGAPESVPGVVFNDVVVMAPQSGWGVEGSVPASVKADEPIKHSYSFLLADAVNTSGESLIQPQAKLKVAVLLLDTETGEIVNANIAPVGGATGIAAPHADQQSSTVASVRYYDLGGRQLTAPQRGINIVSITYNNGTVQTLKMKR